MSRFVDLLVATARSVGGLERGMTTGAPARPTRRTWAEVHREALWMGGALSADGVLPGDAVAVLAGDPALIAPAVQAVWLAGGSVTMLHQPTARTDLATWAADTLRVLAMVDARLVLLGDPFDAVGDVLRQHQVAFRRITELTGTPLVDPVPVDGDRTALLQLTSGSTADPKAVRITHDNLAANLAAMTEAARLDADHDVVVSWLPLFHDMGMVGCLTAPMAFGLELVKATPADFLGRPLLWLELVSEYGGTVTAGPNFAYAVAGRRLAKAEDGALDLSTLRFALNGAEPIDPDAVRTFLSAGARFGLRPECMVCAYGMAEASLGVSFAPLGAGLRLDVVDAEALAGGGRAVPVPVPPAGTGTEAGTEAVPASSASSAVRAFPLLGPPLAGLEVRVVDERGRALGEREVGLIRLRGTSVTPGYLTTDGPVPTQDADGWLDTGDEGYLVGGEVVVCGRRKDVIILGGRNIYPTDIERAACAVDGVRAGNAVALRLDAGSRRERFAVAVESRLAGDPAAERTLRKEVTARVMDAVGARPVSVVVLPPSSLPKTPSGKLRRAAARDRLAPLIDA
ncbi:fatty acyl-AMP ligase [Streptoalloteichus hindustanus]|uniref:Fatty-acyl-CoA synthase n=1 Tax=Streptoalloteichus hindustanus TaxID=2017 RepID=A0A1M5KVH6_STRHI|nr:fatty acyl-AMP ligase [Streptoalloteichus hindustanus]SHG56781.1 fatty-acyl-CoA synthase [Streptoalloteichus hindustanus]